MLESGIHDSGMKILSEHSGITTLSSSPAHEYEQFRTDKFPDKKLVVLTCMDTRLVELLPRAMNLHNGDYNVIKNAGAIVSHPFGSAMRSLLVAIYELNAAEVAVVGHYGCGMTGLSCAKMLQKAIDRGNAARAYSTFSGAFRIDPARPG